MSFESNKSSESGRASLGRDNPSAAYQNTEGYLRRGGPGVTSSNWGGGDGDFQRGYSDLPFGGFFMSPNQLKEVGAAGFSEWGYHPTIRTNIMGRSSAPVSSPRGGRLDNIWSPKNVGSMKSDTLTGEHQRVLEWIMRKMGGMKG